MKQFLNNLFSESSTVSMMRVMAFVTCMTGCWLALHDGSVGVISVLLATAFGGKVTQKMCEKHDG